MFAIRTAFLKVNLATHRRDLTWAWRAAAPAHGARLKVVRLDSIVFITCMSALCFHVGS